MRPCLPLLLLLLVGCASFGGISNKQQDSKTAATGASDARVEQQTSKPAVGSVIISGNGNTIALGDLSKLPRENYSAINNRTGAEKGESHVDESQKSAWYYVLLAGALLIAVGVLDYIRRVWFGGVAFKKQQEGGVRLGSDFLSTLDQVRGESTDQAEVTALGRLRAHYEKKLNSLKLKVRDDRG